MTPSLPDHPERLTRLLLPAPWPTSRPVSRVPPALATYPEQPVQPCRPPWTSASRRWPERGALASPAHPRQDAIGRRQPDRARRTAGPTGRQLRPTPPATAFNPPTAGPLALAPVRCPSTPTAPPQPKLTPSGRSCRRLPLLETAVRTQPFERTRERRPCRRAADERELTTAPICSPSTGPTAPSLTAPGPLELSPRCMRRWPIRSTRRQFLANRPSRRQHLAWAQDLLRLARRCRPPCPAAGQMILPGPARPAPVIRRRLVPTSRHLPAPPFPPTLRSQHLQRAAAAYRRLRAVMGRDGDVFAPPSPQCGQLAVEPGITPARPRARWPTSWPRPTGRHLRRYGAPLDITTPRPRPRQEARERLLVSKKLWKAAERPQRGGLQAAGCGVDGAPVRITPTPARGRRRSEGVQTEAAAARPALGPDQQQGQASALGVGLR